MERIPEPELMVEKKQVISYDEADFSEGEVNLINCGVCNHSYHYLTVCVELCLI